MPAAGTLYQPAPPSLPRAMPGKSVARAGALHPAPFRPAGSPPRAISYSPHTSSSVNTSAVPSLTNGSYARSAHSELDTSSSSGGATSVDLIDLMTDRVGHAVNQIPMDRSIAQQAQTSGALNAKQRELAELQALAQRRLRGTKANLADGFKAAKEVTADLRWTQKRVSQMNAQAAKKHPTAYREASKRYPSPEV